MRVLITGSNGSVAHYMIEYLKNNHQLHGIRRNHHPGSFTESIVHHVSDLIDRAAVRFALEAIQPEVVLHLASMTRVAESFKDSSYWLKQNIIGTDILFREIHGLELKPRILLTSTCEVYGKATYSPMDEDHPVSPLSPYAISKYTQELLARMYYKVYGMDIVITRAFGYINSRREDLFTTQWARQIVDIERGEKNYLEHGNLETSRTLADVRDIVRAYWEVAVNGVSGEAYNVGTSMSYPLSSMLEIMKSYAKCRIPTRSNLSLFRPVDIVEQIPDTTKFKSQFPNFKFQYSLHDSLKFLMDYWRNK